MKKGIVISMKAREEGSCDGAKRLGNLDVLVFAKAEVHHASVKNDNLDV